MRGTADWFTCGYTWLHTTSLHDRRFMSQAGAKRETKEREKLISRSPRLADKAPVMQANTPHFATHSHMQQHIAPIATHSHP